MTQHNILNLPNTTPAFNNITNDEIDNIYNDLENNIIKEVKKNEIQQVKSYYAIINDDTPMINNI